MNTIKQEALQYAQIGWKVLPLEPNSRKIHSTLDVLPDEASNDPAQINEWWNADPNAEIGIATGKASGVITLNLDFMHSSDRMEDLGPINDDGLAEALPFFSKHIGLHYIFKIPPDLTVESKILSPGISLSAEHDYFTAPSPSLESHWDEYAYPSDDIELIYPPEWLMDLMTPKDKKAHRDLFEYRFALFKQIKNWLQDIATTWNEVRK